MKEQNGKNEHTINAYSKSQQYREINSLQYYQSNVAMVYW